MSTPARPFITRLFNAAVITLLATPVLLVQSTLATPPVTERVSVDSAGNQGDGLSETPSISGDGQLIAFASESSNLVDGDTNNIRDIFLHDWLTGTTTRLSTDSQGQEANAASAWPAISADGNWVAFSSAASNLVDGDTNNVEDIFVVELSTGIIERVNLSSSRNEANAPSTEPVISADGRYVAFLSPATNLFTGANSGQTEVYLYDRSSRTLRWVSMPSEGPNDWPSGELAMSADGNWVAFASRSSQLVPGDVNGRSDVFLWSRATGTLEIASALSPTVQGNGSSYQPSLSADGRWLAFRSYASNLAAGDGNGTFDIIRRDRLSGTFDLVTLSSSGEQAVGGSSDEPVISADGRFIAFRSYAENLVPDDDNGTMDIFLRDMQGSTTRVSVDSNGAQSNGHDYAPSISADASAIAFYSVSTNLDLILVDTNGVSDVFSHGDKPLPEPTATPTSEPTPTDGPTPTPTITPSVTPTEEPTPSATPSPTDPPTETPTALPTDTNTPEPTATPTTVPTTVTPDPTEPTNTPEPTEPPFSCSWILDFETDAYGQPLELGQIIDDEWAAWGFDVTTIDPSKHPAMIFNSGQPTGNDADLGTPNESFGGPGIGAGGQAGQPGENRWPLGNVLIITQDMNQANPNDYFAGGTFIFSFDQPARVKSVQLLDIDAYETTVKVSAYDQNGYSLGVFNALALGSNSVQDVDVMLEGVARLEVHLQASGAIASIHFCDEAPVPQPTVEPEPTDPPTASQPPTIELKSELSVKEGDSFSVNGSFSDPDSNAWTATVDFDDGQGEQPLDLSASHSFKLRGSYGDNGDYTAVVRVKDDSGAVGQATLKVKVKNLPPQMTSDNLHSIEVCDQEVKHHGKDLGQSACEIGDWFVATAGEPTVFALNLDDPGSDDLKVHWKFGDDVIYFNNGQGADPLPSPLGNYPFHVAHNAAVIFDKPGVQYVTIEVFDDDGGSTSMQVKVLVRGAQSCRTSLGYWIQRFKKEKYAMYSGELRAHLSILSAFIASSFNEYRPYTIDRLENFILSSQGDSAQARAEMLTAWLNFTNGAVDWDEVIEDADGSHDLPYEEVLHEIFAILLDGDATDDQFEHAIELAKSINLSNRRGRACPVYHE